ncbi:MAG: CPBP family intramembrane glutamic endopeptidase [Bacteroidota bacterium]
MNIRENQIQISEGKLPLISVIIVLSLSLFGFVFLGPAIGVLFTLPFLDFNPGNLEQLFTSYRTLPNGQMALYVLQGFTTLIGFVVIPWFYLRFAEKQSITVFSPKKFNLLPVLVLTALITIAFMPVNSIFVEWNANLKWPAALSELEEFARTAEDRAADMTQFLIDFDNLGQFAVAFLVIAILPGFGEELLFRGYLQNLIHKGSKNPHIAIWVSAILFSAIHLQFFGFVPRVLLGALFGYLYYWSGNLTVPVIAHIVNNGFTLIMVYFHSKGLVNFDIQDTESTPIVGVLVFLVMAIGLTLLFKGYFKKLEARHG